jgi:hypothetical protein
MKSICAAALLSAPLLGSCSFEMDRPATDSGAGRYQLAVVQGPLEGLEPRCFLLDTTTGVLHERDGRSWIPTTDPPPQY